MFTFLAIMFWTIVVLAAIFVLCIGTYFFCVALVATIDWLEDRLTDWVRAREKSRREQEYRKRQEPHTTLRKD